MRFTVKLYALLAAYVPGTRAAAPFEVELPEGSTIADLIQHLQIPPEEMKIAFVNGRMQPLEYLIQEGDEVGMFSPVGGGSEEEMHLDIWLYGDLARRGGREAPLGYAHLELAMPVGSRMQQLLDILDIPTEERGITFINGDLSAMPGLQPDLEHIRCAVRTSQLRAGDVVLVGSVSGRNRMPVELAIQCREIGAKVVVF